MMFGINVFKTLTRASEESPATFTIENNPYRAQKEWPPDFTKLSPKYQLRFERRYRRRTKLKGTKPSWNRNLGLFAAGTSLSFVVYTILFMDLGTGEERNPFAGIRSWVVNQKGSMWTQNTTPIPAATGDTKAQGTMIHGYEKVS